MTVTIKALVLGLAIALPVTAFSQDKDPDAEAIHVRHGLMVVMGWVMQDVAAMTMKKEPFDADRAAIRGARISQLGGMIDDAFARDTSGSDAETAALDAVWSNAAEFSMKGEELIVAANAYADAAQQGEDAARKAFRQLAGGCKGCHEGFKADDK